MILQPSPLPATSFFDTRDMSNYGYYGGDGGHNQPPPQQYQQGYSNYPAQQPPYGQQSHDQYSQGHSPYPQQQVCAPVLRSLYRT